MKPHTFAEMVNRVRVLAFEFGTTEQFRDRVANLLQEYIPVAHGSKGYPDLVLLPCPCCGGTPRFGVDSDEEGGEYIECSNNACRLTTPLRYAVMGGVKALLAEIWNRRSISHDQVLGEVPQGDDPDYQREYAMTVGWIPRDEAFLAKRAEMYAARDAKQPKVGEVK